MSTRHLWIGAAVIVVGGLTTKQLIWNKVSREVREIRDEEHKKSHADLHSAYNRAQQFQLPPLTVEEREKLRVININSDLSKFSQRDSN